MHRYIPFLLSLILFAKPILAQTADLLITGGKIITLEDPGEVEALAIKGDRILAIGKRADMPTGPNTRILDLEGATAFPGFIEGHAHLHNMGLASMNLDVMNVDNWQEIIELVKREVAKKKPGEWIIGRGWHQEKWDRPPGPTVNGYPIHEALSKVSPDNPVFLQHASGHASFANARAMQIAGVNAATPDPSGGAIIRDGKGMPIGIFEETASSLIGKAYGEYLKKQTPEQRKKKNIKAIKAAMNECLSKGITSFHDAGSSFGLIDLFKEMADSGDLSIRLWVMAGAPNAELRSKLPKYHLKDYGDGFLTLGGVKMYVDGALGSRGAWLLEPYSDLPSSTGQNVTSLEDLREAAEIALENNVQLCSHAIGDRGNREILDIYESVLAGRDRRWRIEHAQHLNPQDIPRFAKLNIIASMQGVHCTSDSPFVVKRLGEKRAEEGAYVWRSLISAGVLVTNGTDAPVEDVSPLASYHAMVTRQPLTGVAFYPKQKLTPLEALKCYTINNAYASYQENQKGSLKPGKLADITILSNDITTVDPKEILKSRVLYTIVGGRIVYER